MKKNTPPKRNSAILTAEGDLELFAYTQTRIIPTDKKRLQQNRVITGFKPGEWLGSYKMLRTRCLQFMDARNWSTLAVTSPTGNSGTSLTAVNLALSIAMELSRSVLLVDANFSNPSICKLFGIRKKPALEIS